MNKKILSVPKALMLLSLVGAIFVVSLLLFQDYPEDENSVYGGAPRAVIIDQLYYEIPSEFFHQEATDYLIAAGYEVDIFTTEDVTVDFYKNLPSMNYEYIVVRTHGASAESKDLVTLFTGEPYQDDKYISEQLFGTIKVGAPLQEIIYSLSDEEGNPTEWIQVNETTTIISGLVHFDKESKNEYFVITPKLVKDSMVGTFPDSVIILGGCNTAEYDSMARALIERGAKNVIGWDETISNSVNDQTMLWFLEEALINNAEIDDAVDLVQEKLDRWNRFYDGDLKHYSNENL